MIAFLCAVSALIGAAVGAVLCVSLLVLPDDPRTKRERQTEMATKLRTVPDHLRAKVIRKLVDMESIDEDDAEAITKMLGGTVKP